MSNRIPLMLIPINLGKKISYRLRSLGKLLSSPFNNLGTYVREAGIDVDKDIYAAIAFLNSLLIFILLGGLFFYTFRYLQERALQESILLSLAIGFGMFFIYFIALIEYPKAMARRRADELEKNLNFTLRDLILQKSSGVPVYNSLINVSNTSHGIVAEELKKVARKVGVNTPIDKALEDMASNSESSYLKKIVWQIVNTLKAGSSLDTALKSTTNTLTKNARSSIKSYSGELNLWVLMYMLFAVALPTIGGTLLIILSSFAGGGLNRATFLIFIGICFTIQFVIVGFIKTRRPLID